MKRDLLLRSLSVLALLSLPGCGIFDAAGDTVQAVGSGTGHVVRETGDAVGDVARGTGDAVGDVVDDD